ncbi:MAG TPA: RIP metalloprotease RseP [Blastocatellia bacterium]|nr:RIP metalloprotease RseP [Blastocatellia bacterium]
MALTLNTAWIFALVLGGMVVLHELGHFIVARLFGIRVETFSVGFGPRLWGLKRGNTDYRLSLIPLGGYVKMAGENLDEQLTGAPYEFMSKPKWQRFCVAIAGPTANILTAIAIPLGIAMVHNEDVAYYSQPPVIDAVGPDSSAEKAGLKPGDLIVAIGDEVNPTWEDIEDTVALSPDVDLPVVVKRGEETKTLTVRPAGIDAMNEKIGDAGFFPSFGPNVRIMVTGVFANSPAEGAGLAPGDQIVGINGKPVAQNPSGQFAMIGLIKKSNGQPITLTVQREGKTVDLTASPRQEDGGDYRLGFNQVLAGVERTVNRLGPAAALRKSIKTNLRTIKLTKTVLGDVFAGRRKFSNAVSGPVGIFVATSQAAEIGPRAVLGLAGLLSLSLGLINLFPIPVLDGGLIFMLVLESILGIFGLPLTLRAKERMMQVGFVAIVLLMAFVIYSDVAKLMPSRSSPQPADSRPAGK